MYKIIDIRNDLPVNKKRIEAGGKIPKRTLPIKRIVVHCTDDDDKPGHDVYATAKYDINPNHISSKGCFTITYAYYIERVAKKINIYYCVDHNVITWHVGVWNKDSLGIAIDKKGMQKASEKRKAAIWLCAHLCKQLGLTYKDVVFHRELQYTGWNWDKEQKKKIYRKSCPGWAWDPEKFRQDVKLQLVRKSNAQLCQLFKGAFRRLRKRWGRIL